MKVKDWLRQYLIKKQNSRYERRVQKQHESYDAWIRRLETDVECNLKEDLETGNSSQEVASLGSDTDFVWLPMQKGSLVPEAEQEVRMFFARHPECRIVYADEDVLEKPDGERSAPWFKPDWSPDTFLSYDYFGNPVAVRKSFWLSNGFSETISWDDRRQALLSGVKECGGFEKGCHAIGHLSKILFHGLEEKSRYIYVEQAPIVNETKETGKISVIIPSKDNVSVLKQCITSVMRTAGKRELEFLIVDNGSCENTIENINKLKEDLTKEYPECAVTYLYEPMEFNFSKMCNLGAKAADGEYLLFLNDDTQAVCDGWLDAMVEKAAKPYVGAVGMKLLYPDSGRIQHAGVVNLPMGPVHKLQFLPDERDYYFKWNKTTRNVAAVTAACLMIKSERFEQTGGFCEELKVAFNDVELSFRLLEAGYHNVVINEFFLYHHESLSRGNDETEEKWKRLMAERDKLYEKHPGLKGKDPYYSVFLNRNGLDTRILPGNEDISITAHKAEAVLLRKEPDYTRKDECLLIRVERIEERSIQGYAVVLGSNNACYEKEILLKREDSEAVLGRKDNYGYKTALPPVYRSDLKENMPDQENVALCGFHICLSGEMEPGSYRVGVIARDLISGQKILNFTSRSIRIR